VRFTILMAVLSMLLLGCNEQQCLCTLNFVSIRVTVLSPSGTPEAGVNVQTTLLRTGEKLDVNTAESGGVYTVLDDGFAKMLDFRGDRLGVVGVKSDLSFTAEFVARPDGACRCHIEKVSGPESVMLAQQPNSALHAPGAGSGQR